MMRAFFARLLLLAPTVVLIHGCGNNAARVTGQVTYEGELVGRGTITFLPVDGKGPTAGAAIVNGSFTVEDMLPGEKVVQIEAVKAVPFARSSEEMARMAAASKTRGDGSGIIDPADVIPPNAEGNHVNVNIKPGKQTRDFHLKKPADKKGR